MKLVSSIKESKLIFSGSGESEYTIPFPIDELGNLKMPFGADYNYIVFLKTTAAITTLKWQCLYNSVTYDIQNSTFWSIDNTTGYTFVAHTPLANQLSITLSDDGDVEAWLGKTVPIEGYSPESFGHYYITKTLSAYNLKAGETVDFIIPVSYSPAGFAYLLTTGSIDIDVVCTDGSTLKPITLTSGVYTDYYEEAISFLPYLAHLRYAKQLTITANADATVIIDVPIISL